MQKLLLLLHGEQGKETGVGMGKEAKGQVGKGVKRLIAPLAILPFIHFQTWREK